MLLNQCLDRVVDVPVVQIPVHEFFQLRNHVLLPIENFRSSVSH